MSRAIGFAAISTLVALGIFAASQAQAAPNMRLLERRHPQAHFLATKPQFAKPRIGLLPVFPVVHGDLRCKTAALDECVVANMPLMNQTDPSLHAPLVQYSGKYKIASGPHTGKIEWSEPQFGIGPDYYMPGVFATNIMDNGCYITALTTLEIAALANTPVGTAVQPRAKTLAGVNGLAGLGPDLSKLEWQYRRWADKLQPNTSDPSQPGTPDFLELDEFAGDFPPGVLTFTDEWNPTHATASDFTGGMIANKTYLIAYQRYNVSAGKTDASGKIHVKLSYDSHHKIAVSGFQPGTYPLLIDDVGNGQRYQVRVTSDVKSITFTQSGAAAISPSKLVVDAPTGSPNPLTGPVVYLVYEGADDVTVGSGQLIMIEDIQSLAFGPPTHPIKPPCKGTQCY